MADEEIDNRIKSTGARYARKIEEKLENKKVFTDSYEGKEEEITSSEYLQFKKDLLPQKLEIYEKLCNFSHKLLKLKANPKEVAKLQEAIDITHLNITPDSSVSFAVFVPFVIGFVGAAISFIILDSIIFLMIFLMIAGGLMFYFTKLPYFFATNWRLKASNQMILSIFYVVTFMRHTSNLERAIDFASNHLDPPLSLDFKKILWDIQTEKYSTLKESLDSYLATWAEYNSEFVESFHLIESSLFEGSDSRRLELLDRSVDVILNETYEKMLHYAHDLKGPITILHMMGVILPLLGLVILPLVSSFLTNKDTSPGEIALFFFMIYNLLLPLGIYITGKVILSKRPTGYGEIDISQSPAYREAERIEILGIPVNPLIIAGSVFAVLFFISMMPLILHAANPEFDIEIVKGTQSYLLGYQESKVNVDKIIGPYGIGATILSLFFTLSLALGFAVYYKLKSRNVIKIRDETKKIEEEFAESLFQLGNRLGDGLPAEIAFQRIAETSKVSMSGKFFSVVSENISRLGMGMEQAIFHPKLGAVNVYPSKLISSSMKVLIESSRKGPKISAQAMINISRYVKEMKRVDNRLKDLLADVISSMKSQISFLAPSIAGVVVGITSMITEVLTRLTVQLKSAVPGEAGGGAAAGGFGDLFTLFGDSIPPYYFQMIVGLYIVQLIYILSQTANTIENGSDKLSARFSLGTNFLKGAGLYFIISLLVILIFHTIAVNLVRVQT